MAHDLLRHRVSPDHRRNLRHKTSHRHRNENPIYLINGLFYRAGFDVLSFVRNDVGDVDLVQRGGGSNLMRFRLRSVGERSEVPGIVAGIIPGAYL